MTDHDNRATAGVSADSSYQEAILPMALCIKENLEIELIDYYSPGYSLLFNDTEPRSEKEEAETAAMLFECGLITRNEGRMRVGQDVLPEGDIFATEAQAEKTGDDAKQIAIKDSN